uniref:Uncharacterized protein n=1 Tax=Anguilla anguilla TaxID=7936 RepID=A0A0E9VEF2_ANGAN
MNCEKGCSGKSQIRLDLEDRTQKMGRCHS